MVFFIVFSVLYITDIMSEKKSSTTQHTCVENREGTKCMYVFLQYKFQSYQNGFFDLQIALYKILYYWQFSKCYRI